MATTHHPRRILGMEGENAPAAGATLVRVEDLRLGMTVHELDKPWTESGFLMQGFRINDLEELAQLRRECRYVYASDNPVVDMSITRLTQGSSIWDTVPGGRII